MTLFAAFEGEVLCEPLGVPGGWRLSGRARGLAPARAGEPLQLLLNGTRDLDPPATLQDAELELVDATSGASASWSAAAATAATGVLAPVAPAAPAARSGCVLRGRAYGRAFTLRSAQLHLGVSPALVALLAPPPAPAWMRALAWLLLNLARVPGVAGLLARNRADHGGG
jgi:hypothetical protein